MIRRALLATAFAIAVLAAGAVPAHAIPPGNNLIVFAYYSDGAKTHLVGQKWSGCNQPSGSWGVTTGIYTLYFTPC